MNCIYLKQKLNKSLECKLNKNKIIPNDCKGCPYKEYKVCRNSSFEGNFGQKQQKNSKKCTKTSKNSAIQEKNSLKLSKNVQIKRKSSKLAKLEKERFSLFTDDNNKCFICGSTYNLTWHEIFRGRNRPNSMKYGLCLRFCINCHELYQENKEFNDCWHIKGQLKFEEVYKDLKFEDIFKINYLDK